MANLSQPKNFRNLLIVAVFAVLGFLLYSHTFHFPFIFDDVAFIVGNAHIRLSVMTWSSLIDIINGPLWNRPLTMLSFALNYYFGHYNVEGYHTVNIAIHIMTGILLVFFIKTTLNIFNKRSPDAMLIAFFAALLWFVNPLCTQAVTYIFQRGHSMASMFYILSLCLYARGRLSYRSDNKYFYIWLTGCAFSGILAMLSKGISATLPFFIILYEWYFFQDIKKEWLRKNIKWILPGIMTPFIIFGIIHLLAGHQNEILMDYSTLKYTVLQRMLTETRIVIYYLSLIFYPHPSRLIFDYDFPVSHSLIDPVTTLFSLGLIAGLIWTACYTAKRGRLISFCIFWYLGNLAIEAIFPYDFIWDYRTYLPSMMVSLLFVILILRMIKHSKAATLFFCMIVLVFSVWTYQRNSVYQSEISIWSDAVKKSPDKVRPYNNLAFALIQKGRYKEAMRYCFDALRINPDSADAHNHLGEALMKQGQITEAVGHYMKALQIRPDYLEAHYNLGEAMLEQGRLEEAFRYYTNALSIKPDLAQAYSNLGIILTHQGKLKMAVEHYMEALRLNPGLEKAHNNLGVALLRQEKFNQAIVHFQQALRIKPDYTNARDNLKKALELK